MHSALHPVVLPGIPAWRTQHRDWKVNGDESHAILGLSSSEWVLLKGWGTELHPHGHGVGWWRLK